MTFKKFFSYLNEKKKSDAKDIQDVSIPVPNTKDPNEPLACPKCGTSKLPCECYTEDYYNAKLSHWAPRPNRVIRPKKEENEKA